MNFLTTVFLFIIGFFMGLFNPGQNTPLPTFEEQKQQIETQAAWDNYYLLDNLRSALRQYQFEENRYPETLNELHPDYITFQPEFDFSQVSYVVSMDAKDYTLCLRHEPEKNICVLKHTFLPDVALTPTLYTSDKPLGDEFYMETWDTLKGAYGDQFEIEKALLAIADWRYRSPDSIEYFTLYGWYLLETSHVYGSEYYPDTLEQARSTIERASDIDPNNMQVLLLEYNLAWIDNNQTLANAKERQLLKQYPDSDIVKIETVYSATPQKNITYLEEFLSKPQSSIYLRKSAYHALATAYKQLQDHDKVITTYQRLTAEYKHPWDFQSLGFYWLREKNDCEEAIKAFNEGLAHGEIGIMRHNNLPTAYAVCAEKYAADEEYDKAIEYMQIAVENNENLPTCECEAEYLAGLGDYYYQRGKQNKTTSDLEKAIVMYDKALQEDPTLNSAISYKKRQTTTVLKNLL